MIPYLGSPMSRSGALSLLGAVGTPDDARLIRPFITSSYGGESPSGLRFDARIAAVTALLQIGDCSSTDSVRQLLKRGELNPCAWSSNIFEMVW